jgi:hypothetical protein
MIESIMYFAIGFFAAGLTVLVVVPLVHGRAVRLTTRRLEAALPASAAEVCADKDLLRAEFAVSTRRLEVKIEQLTTNSASQRAELGRTADAICAINCVPARRTPRSSSTPPVTPSGPWRKKNRYWLH